MMRKNFARKVLAASCFLAMLQTPMTALATPAQTSPREGIPVVSVTASKYSDIAISKVSNYVNVRSEANTSGEIVGKIYNDCAATILATVNGEGGTWYKIQSGTVTGYIKAQYFVTGSEAEKIAKEIGTVYVTVSATTLRLREEPNTDSRTLTLLSEEAEYIAIGEEGDFVKIQVDESLSGYVHKDYIKERVDFASAVSLAEEAEQAAEAERLKKEAEDAIAKLNQLKEKTAAEAVVADSTPAVKEPIGTILSNPNGESGSPAVTTAPPTAQAPAENTGETGNEGASNIQAPVNSETTGTSVGTTTGPTAEAASGPAIAPTDGSAEGPGASQTTKETTNAELTSATRTAIVAYAKQFLGNKYVYGGTSLTNGTDCSGFTMRIFEHFGIDTGRSSRDQAANGREIALSEIQPGDLIFYASGSYINHVALYIGGGQIIHASNSKTGIVTSTAYYRTPYKAVTFLN